MAAPELPCDNIGRTADALHALPVLGISLGPDVRFPCILPGHHVDPEPSAAIRHDPQTGLWKYQDRHHQDFGTDRWLRLCDVRAALATGKVEWLPDALASIWYLRLWHEAGLIEPRPVTLPHLRETVPEAQRRVAEGFRRLVGLRRRAGHFTPVPFASRFIGPWCGLSEHAAVTARRDLLDAGVIRRVGSLPNGGLRDTHLYEPGTCDVRGPDA